MNSQPDILKKLMESGLETNVLVRDDITEGGQFTLRLVSLCNYECKKRFGKPIAYLIVPDFLDLDSYKYIIDNDIKVLYVDQLIHRETELMKIYEDAGGIFSNSRNHLIFCVTEANEVLFGNF